METNKKKINKETKRKIKYILFTILTLLFVIGVSIYIYINSKLDNINYTDWSEEVIANEEIATEFDADIIPMDEVKNVDIPKPIVVKSQKETANITNILLVGEENFTNSVRGRTDSMMILSLDEDSGKVKLTSLMRDSFVEIDGYGSNRLNAAYAFGGMPLLKDTIEKNYGVKINNSVLVNFEGFKSIIDVLGGVEVELSQEEADYINDMGLSQNRLVAGLNTLDGYQALGYCRTRYVSTTDGEANDFGRTNRQRKILSIIFSNYKDASLSELIDLVDTLSPYITTDLSKSRIIDLVKTFTSSDISNLETLRLPIDGSYENKTISGMAVLSLDWDKNRDALYEYIYGVKRTQENETPQSSPRTQNDKTVNSETIDTIISLNDVLMTNIVHKNIEIKNRLDNVTLIGDSLTVGLEPYFASLVPNATINGKIGRQASEGFSILKDMSSNGTLGDVIIIELGTNGPFDIQSARDMLNIIGTDKEVFWVNTYGPGLSWYNDSNAVISQICNEYDNVTLIDWASYGQSHTGYYGEDGIHLYGTGYSAMAQFIYDNIQ